MMASGNLRVADIFSDHMILQRGKEATVWGICCPGEKVVARIKDKTIETVADTLGSWMLRLPAFEAGGPYRLVVESGEEQCGFDDVWFGEVWIAAGQSNMALELSECDGWETLQKDFHDPLLRYSRVGAEGTFTSWQACAEGSFGNISGTAFYCAEALRQKLGVPVGVIICAYPGTSIACWMDRRLLVSDPPLSSFLSEAEQEIKGVTDDVCRKRYEDFWKRKDMGSNEWPPPVWSGSPYFPGNLFERMIRKTAPYTARGVLYYQGEEDTSRAQRYERALDRLISQWREIWMDGDLSFVIGQLPVYLGKGDKDDRSWAYLRQSQERVSANTNNTFLAVLLDCGAYNTIHPTDKRTPGERFAQVCLRSIYGNEKTLSFPHPIGAERAEDGKLLILLSGIEGKITASGDLPDSLFELAGVNGKFMPALAAILDDHIILRCPTIPCPVSVRYAFWNYCGGLLKDSAGMPLIPFSITLGNS